MPGGYKAITIGQIRIYRDARKTMNRTQAAKASGISVPTAKKIDDGEELKAERVYRERQEVIDAVTDEQTWGVDKPKATKSGKWAARQYDGDDFDDPMDLTNPDLMDPYAYAALDNFALWRRMYLGRLSTPWQEDAAYQVIDWLHSPVKEYVVINAPPGSGKSTLFTHDIPAWLACRDRTIRVIIGSRTERQAKMYVGRLKRTFERRRAVQADPNELALGLATDAWHTLPSHYGRFKPIQSELWRMDELILAQPDDATLEDKEPSFAAYGMDSGFLGSRANLVIWDDLADKTTMRTVDSREAIKKWWDDEASTRLEPGGVVLLQGQRMGPDDIYRHALDQLAGDDLSDDEEEDEDGDGEVVDDEGRPKEGPKQYRHVIYQAHDESRCKMEHKKTSPYWPNGCLLDPRRLPWKGREGLKTIRANREEKYQTLYQQEDVDPAKVLVQKVWVDGGMDEQGMEHIGCKDKDRGLCQLPKGLHGRLISIATVDPSPTKNWAIEWWVVRQDEGGFQERYLMDLVRRSMTAPELIDYIQATQSFVGIMDDWQARSRSLHLPISHWIVEKNAAQRFMLQYDFVRRWMAKNKVAIIGHETHKNKSDEDFGIQTLAPQYKYGRVRLPCGDNVGLLASLKLIEEATHYPEWRTDDTVLAQWFLEWNLPKLFSNNKPQPKAIRPSWMGKEAAVLEAVGAGRHRG